jgi:hypothetical protein
MQMEDQPNFFSLPQLAQMVFPGKRASLRIFCSDLVNLDAMVVVVAVAVDIVAGMSAYAQQRREEESYISLLLTTLYEYISTPTREQWRLLKNQSCVESPFEDPDFKASKMSLSVTLSETENGGSVMPFLYS